MTSHSYSTNITKAYNIATRITLNKWSHESEIGRIAINMFCNKMGVSSGFTFAPKGKLLKIYSEISDYSHIDELLDIVPFNSLHFTYIPLSQKRFESAEEVPNEICSLIHIFQQITKNIDCRITKLRLIPRNNSLLVAGIPDIKTYISRRELLEQALETPWAPYIKERYLDIRNSPTFFHSTLVRYRADFAPCYLREIFYKHSNVVFEDLHLGQPKLVVMNYNWSKCHVISD